MDEENFLYQFKDISNIGGRIIKAPEVQKKQLNGYDVFEAALEFEYITAYAAFTFENMKLANFNRYYLHKKEWQTFKISAGSRIVERRFLLESGGILLNAAFTYIDDGKRHPTALLIPGSGLADLDAQAWIFKPFADLSAELARKGINTLRFDKRTMPYYNFYKPDGGIEDEYLIDCRTAVEYAFKQEATDKENFYLIGHSLGGVIAAELSKEIKSAGIVILNSSARNLAEIACDQYSANNPANKKYYEEIRDIAININNKNNLKGAYYFLATDYYWYSLNKCDTIKNIKSSGVKTLIINSLNDKQAFKADIDLWQEALGECRNVKIKVFEKPSHFLYEFDVNQPSALYKRLKLPGYIVYEIAEFIK
jgi:pimeloyl-ACP methyl ester carboxylesterase